MRIFLSDIVENIDSIEYKITDTCEENIIHHVNDKNIKVDDFTLAYEIRPSRCQFVKMVYLIV